MDARRLTFHVDRAGFFLFGMPARKPTHYNLHMRECARLYWEALLVKHGGNVSAVARDSGYRRTSIYSALASAGVVVPAHKPGDINQQANP